MTARVDYVPDTIIRFPISEALRSMSPLGLRRSQRRLVAHALFCSIPNLLSHGCPNLKRTFTTRLRSKFD